MADQDDISRLALRTLEDALAQAEHGLVQPEWAHRLALTCLLRAGVAEAWQCRKFWTAMLDPCTWATTPERSQDMRTDALSGFLNNWYYRIGLQPPSLVTRAARANALSSPVDSIDSDGELAEMCNRYAPGDRHAITALFNARELRAFNDGPATVHPKDPGWVIRPHQGELVLDQMTWGFPVVLKGKQGQPLKPKPVNNARFGKLNTFWRRWAVAPHQRCLVPTARYAEAVDEKGRMTETWLSLKSHPVFAWAGLWRSSPEWGDCYTGVMTSACSQLAHIHDRSPVILEPHQWQAWLTMPLASLSQFDRPFPAEGVEVDATAKLWAAR